MDPHRAILALWGLWVVTWMAAAFWSSRAAARPPLKDQLAYRVPLIVGGILLFTQIRVRPGLLRLWDVGEPGAWACVAAVAAGIALAWWARIHLGKLWSGNVTLKAGHRVVETGPYALVRHPIYTGLLLGLLATAVAKGTAFAAAGFAGMLWGIWLKARLEERWLSQQLDPAAYASYRRRVPMLVPGIGGRASITSGP